MKAEIVKKINYISVLLIAIVTFSCVSTKTLLIDIPQPSPNELPSSIQSLALVSQTVDKSYTDLDSDSLQKIFYQGSFNLDTVINDLHMVDTTMKALGELLFESGRYDFVIPHKRFIDSQKNSGKSSLLPWNEVETICENFNTDAVLSLDYLQPQIITRYDNETVYDPYQGGFYSASAAQMNIYYDALFRVYDPKNKKIILRQSIRDTLFWQDIDISTRSLFERFTPVKQALAETGIAIALEITDKIAVRWHTESRKYFINGNKELKKAGEFLDNGDAETAIGMLKEIETGTNSKTIKSKAQLNIAVSYEILGNLNQAINWALKSYNTQYRPLTYEYLEKLKRRKKKVTNQSK